MGKMSKRTVTLEIAGARYRMSSDADETLLHELSELINGRIAELEINERRMREVVAMLRAREADLVEIVDRQSTQIEGY